MLGAGCGTGQAFGAASDSGGSSGPDAGSRDAGSDAGGADAGGDAGPNQPPTCNAGADQTITLPTNSVTLTATAADPDGDPLTYAWTKTAGGAATIATPAAASTQVTGLVAGTYTFTLAVTDGRGGTATGAVAVIVNRQSAYYVSPAGADSNDGTSPLAPFKTLEKAQAAVRASTTKTVYLLGGVYARSATLQLDAADAGESWLGFPGQTPILDGGSSTITAIFVQADRVTVRWLTVRNFVQNGIVVGNWGTPVITGDLVDSNVVLNTLSTDWTQAGILVLGNVTAAQLTHNRIDRTQYNGIGVHATAGTDISGLTIASNAISNTCLSIADCGGIYAMDRGHASTQITIDNNIVGNYGTTSNGSKGIYLDDDLSNVTVRNNIVYGTGQWAFQIHGGNDDVFTNNVFDISGATRLAVYQDDGTPNYGMSANSFSCNIVYSRAAPPSELWDDYAALPVALPAVSNNLYWDTGGALPNSGSIVDSSPTVADPAFVDPAAANYAFAAGNPAAFCGFKPIDVSQVGPLPNL